MQMKLKRCAAAVCALALAMGNCAFPVSAAERTKVVLLGDSISSGTGLAEGEAFYGDFLRTKLGTDVENLAYDTCTTVTLLEDLDRSDVQAELSDADIIVVTVGMHDLMDPFMARANELMEEFGFEHFSDVFTARLEDYNMTEDDFNAYYSDLRKCLRDKADAAGAAANMLAIGEKLASYTDATVIYQKNYNCINTIENLDSLSANRQFSYKTVTNLVQYYVENGPNASIDTLAQTYPCQVVDVQTAFAGLAYKYTNLEDLDLNPNAAGHAWIGVQIRALLPDVPYQKGDVNGNGETDAVDASLILIHAAAAGNGDSTLSGEALACGDVDGSGDVDAVDASLILQYAAKLGTGQIPEL